MATGIGDEVIWWCPSLDPNKTGAIVTDLTGNGNNGTIVNGDTPWGTSGGFDYIDLNGQDSLSVNKYITGGLTFPANDDFTLGFWAYHVAYGKYAGYSTADMFMEQWGGTRVRFNGTYLIWGSIRQSLGAWIYNEVKRVSGLVTVRFDNTILAGQTQNNSWRAERIGSILSSVNYQSFMLVDDIRYFNRSLTTQESDTLASNRVYQPSTGQQSPIHSRAIGRLGPLRGIVR